MRWEDRWMGVIATAGAIMFLIVIVLYTLAQTFLPAFGLTPGQLSDLLIVYLFVSFLAIVTGAVPAALRWMTGKKDKEE